MADDTLQTGSDSIATDELSFYNGVDVSTADPRPKVQRTKVGFGVDGTYDDVTADNPLPTGLRVYDGANWNRLRSYSNLEGSNGTAAVGAGLFLWDTAGGGLYRDYTARSIGDAENGIAFGTTSLMTFNGVTWDRVRSATSDALTVGVPASALMAYWSGGGQWQRVRIAEGDALNTGVLGVGNLVYNGSSWDRARGRDGAAEVTQGARLSTLNSPAHIALAAGATFTGGWEDALHDTFINIGVAHDGGGAGVALQVQHSMDGSTVISTDTLPADNFATHTTRLTGRYFRVRFTMGTVAATDFSLTTVKRPTYPAPYVTGTQVFDNMGGAEIPAFTQMLASPAGTLFYPRRNSAGDGFDGAGLAGAGGFIYNGATWDRLRGSGSLVGSGSRLGMLGVEPLIYNLTTNTFSGQVFASADALASPPLGAAAIYNGASWDRLRSATAAEGATDGVAGAVELLHSTYDGTYKRRRSVKAITTSQDGDGIAASGVFVSDGANWTPLRSGLPGSATATLGTMALLQDDFDGSMKLSEVPRTDGKSYTTVQPAAGMVYNGSTWDRLRSASASGVGMGTTGIPTSAPAIWDSVAAQYYPMLAARGVANGNGGGQMAASLATGINAGGTFDPLRVLHAIGDGADGRGVLGAGTMVFNGTTWDRMRVAADGVSAALAVGMQVWNGTNFSVVRTPTDALGINNLGASGTMVFNGTNWDRARGGTDASAKTGYLGIVSMVNDTGANQWNMQRAAYADALNGSGLAATGSYVFNGGSWDRARGDITNGLDVDVTRLPSLPTGANVIGAVTQSGTWTADTELAAAAALADAAANPTVPTVGAANLVFNGTTWDRARGTIANGLLVDVSRVQGTVAVTQSTSPWVVDTELPAAAALSDAFANPTAPAVGSAGLVYNGSTWDRLRTASGDAFAATGLQAVGGMVWNGTGWDRQRGASTAAGTSGTGLQGVGVLGFDGTNYQRIRTDTSGNQHVRPSRNATTYEALFRLATDTANPALSFAFTANTSKQWAYLWHAVGSTKTVRIRKVILSLTTTAATVLAAEIRPLTTAPTVGTGGPAVTPRPHNTASAAAEVTAAALPQTAGTDSGTGTPLASKVLNLLAAATTTQQPLLGDQEIVLYEEARDGKDDTEPITMRAGVAEGIAVVLRSTAAVTLTGTIRILFTEET